jgi:hypothetical protein
MKLPKTPIDLCLLLRLMNAGDEEAFSTLYHWRQRGVYSQRRWTRGRHDPVAASPRARAARRKTQDG